jgi:hypothetical protein
MRTRGYRGMMIAIGGESLIGGIAREERRTGRCACATEGEQRRGPQAFIFHGEPARETKLEEQGRAE